MDITAFIRELLFGHDCVIVPGFGGFIGNYTPALIVRESGLFYPPVKQISFNRNLNHNDGLLIGKISESLKVTYGDARNLADNFVGDLRRKLDRGEKVVFDNIGSFVNNQEGNVLFEPDRNVNYHLDSYGLDSFQCMPLEGYDVRHRIVKHVQKDPVKQASMRKLLWRAAVIIPLLSVILAIPFKTDLFKARIETTTLNPLVTAEFEHNKNAVDEAGIIEKEKAEENILSSKEVVAVPEIKVPVAVETTAFCVITGSFRSEENAVFQINKLKGDGFTPEIFTAPNGFYRVSAMSCSDQSTALSKKDSISKKYPQAWVLRKKI